MSANRHRKHSVGLNDAHALNILTALKSGDGYKFDMAVTSVPGTMMSVRSGARGLVEEFLRSGGELPLPRIDNIPPSLGSLPLSSTVEVDYNS